MSKREYYNQDKWKEYRKRYIAALRENPDFRRQEREAKRVAYYRHRFTVGYKKSVPKRMLALARLGVFSRS